VLPRPHPRLIWRVSTLWRQARSTHAQLLAVAARLRFGALVVPADALERRLVEAASSVVMGESLVLAIITANVEAHGPDVVDTSAHRALDRLADPRSRSKSWARSRARANLARALATFHERAGGIVRPLELLESIADATPCHGGRDKRLITLRQQAQLLRSGVRYGSPMRRGWDPSPGRVLYYANQALPHHSSGYAIRTHGLARTLRDKGWAVSVYTRLGYPNDRYDFIGVRTADSRSEIDGVPYRFTPEGRRGRSIADYQTASVEALLGHCAELRPSILHAATNYNGGLAGTEVARRLGIPSVYEVRGLWHITRASAQPEYLDSDHYRMIERLEVQAAMHADHVFTITEAVGQVLIKGGVAADKISVLPNAVDATTFVARARDPELEHRWRLGGAITIGYIGAFKDYEGLDYLLQAAALLRRRVGDSFRLLLVGDGKAGDDLRALSKRLDLSEIVRFTGRVPHEATPDYYALCDIIAFPRKGLRVCEVVSPIKPFEAMAAQKAVVVSDVRALTEIVWHAETGLVHRKDDVGSLAEQLERYLREPSLRTKLARRGRDWIVGHRTWSRVSDTVDRVYRQLTK
jgi:glycosyltransferase involved in cell wall biosynthesis